MDKYVRTYDRLPLPRSSNRRITGSAARQDEYPVHVTRSEEVALGHLIDGLAGRRAAMITDDTVAELHARRLVERLRERGVDVVMTAFPAGEASKSLRTAFTLLDWLASTSLARRDVILAVGGGVVIDTVGWVASAYMRGVPYVNVPTTLLADVDAALGGKVAVDHDSAKNLIGAFYQPKAVVSNISYLNTLDIRQIRAGLAEAIKKGIIASPALFDLIDDTSELILGQDLVALEDLVQGASAIKCELIARDPYEVDLRRPLNFGHTIGHAVETATGYGPVLHGEAVAFGMSSATRIAENRGLLATEVRERIVELLNRVGLPTSLDDFAVWVDVDSVIAAMGQIRKIRDGKIRFVLPVELGETVIADDVTDHEILSALRSTYRERTVIA